MSLIETSLSDSDISKDLRSLPNFGGVYASDNIPSFKERPVFIVANTDPHPQPHVPSYFTEGEHWVAIVLLDGARGVYFDPLGFPPLIPETQEYLSQFCGNGFKYNNVTIQNALGKGCGYYCIEFLKHMSRGGKLKTFLTLYPGRIGNELIKNDNILYKNSVLVRRRNRK